MSHRLQVLLEEEEYRRLRQAARLEGTTVAEWVRRALRAGLGRRSGVDAEKKLAVLQVALKNEFPTAEVDQMLREISEGRSDRLPE